MIADPTAAQDAWPRAWTLATPLDFEGVGVHSGMSARVRLVPAPAGHGFVFHRVDLPGAPAIPARAEHVSHTVMSTTLSVEDCAVHTVEHLLAALAGLGVTDARIEVDGPEVPILDGSAWPFVEAIRAAGIRVLDAPRPVVALPLAACSEGDKTLTVVPGSHAEVTYAVDFGHPLAGPQLFHALLTPAYFAREIAPARTFGFLRDVEALRAAGLAKGGSVENAIVIMDDRYSSELRFADELVRHKVLDLIGDLALLGASWTGHVVAVKAGHKLHNALARQVGATVRRTAPPVLEAAR
jgi:UDP-3-O-[3-hydroxymyristoyl] N-acetylglucosamine deacetylase